MTTADPISLAAERAAERLRRKHHGWNIEEDIDALDAARVLLQEYEVAEQDIREQVAGTIHEQPPALEGPRYLRAVFESMRMQSVKAQTE